MNKKSPKNIKLEKKQRYTIALAVLSGIIGLIFLALKLAVMGIITLYIFLFFCVLVVINALKKPSRRRIRKTF
jgi:hypothetical protein